MRKTPLILALLLLVFSLCLFRSGSQVKTLAAEEGVVVEYGLPYPGMLADSPLYFLKNIRDRVLLMTISDPRQKAFYLLHLSDKRIATAGALGLKKNFHLAAETAMRAEEYFGKAVDQASEILSKKEDNDLLAKLTVARAKHMEIIDSLTNFVIGNDLATIQKAGLDNRKSGERVMKFLIKK